MPPLAHCRLPSRVALVHPILGLVEAGIDPAALIADAGACVDFGAGYKSDSCAARAEEPRRTRVNSVHISLRGMVLTVQSFLMTENASVK